MDVRNVIGLVTLSKRELIRFLSVFTQTIIPPYVSSILFILIFGLSVGRNLEWGAGNVSYLDFLIPGIITMTLISSSYENTSSSLFISRWHNHIQEVLLSPLSYIEMVLGLLVGGLTRGILVAVGVFLISRFFSSIPIMHPLWLLYFTVTISIIFSSAGLLVALWADNFGMLTVWNTYLITPAVFLGGVFNPIEMVPESLQTITRLNPMFYLVSGMRYSFLGVAEAPVMMSALLCLGMAAGIFAFAVHLFRIGYKLRT